MTTLKAGSPIEVPLVIRHSDSFQNEETFELDHDDLIAYYILLSIRFYFTPHTYFENLDGKQEFQSVLDAFVSYRRAVARDHDFIDALYKKDYHFKNILRQTDDSPLSPANFGVVCSSNLRDIKFVLKTLRNFTRKFQPEMDIAPRAVKKQRAFSELQKQFQNLSDLFVTNEKLSMAGNPRLPLSMEYKQALPSAKEIVDSVQQEHQNHIMEYAAIATFVFGKEARTRMCYLYGSPELSDGAVEKRASSFLVEPSTTFFCAPEYWELLLNTYMQQILPQISREEVLALTSSSFLPIYNQIKQSMDHAVSEKASLQAQVYSLENQINGITSFAQDDSVPDLKKEIELLKIDLCNEQRKALKLESSYNCSQNKLSNLEAKVSLLTEMLEQANSCINTLNNELIEICEDSGILIEPEDDEKQDAPAVLSGLQERLGDDAVKRLQSKRVLIVGGHVNTHTTLKELFPNWEYESELKAGIHNNVSSVDYICMITCYCSHKAFNAARELAKSAKVPFILSFRNSPCGICEKINSFIIEETKDKE